MDRWGRSQMWFHKVFCDVAGRRHLPGICRYPAKCTGHAVNQGGTADKCFVRPWQKVYFCQGRFFETPLTEDITSKESFLFQRRLRYGVFKTMVAYPAPNNFEYPHCKFPAWFRQAVGISTPEQAKKMANISDGAIVGSAIIKLLEQYGKDAPKYIGEYVKKMKMALLTN